MLSWMVHQRMYGAWSEKDYRAPDRMFKLKIDAFKKVKLMKNTLKLKNLECLQSTFRIFA